jgi:hypothetical protein
VESANLGRNSTGDSSSWEGQRNRNRARDQTKATNQKVS